MGKLYKFNTQLSATDIMFKLIISVLLLSKIALIQGQGQGCQVCEAAVGEAQSFLKNNATDTQILNFLTANVCYPFSGTFAQLCKDYITEEFPVIIQQLESDSPQQCHSATAKRLCRLFHLQTYGRSSREHDCQQ